ncbi:AAA family ATPase [Lachnospiraceae bacterium 29-84]
MDCNMYYGDLSPTKKAAMELAQKLPDQGTMGGEAWNFFHLETEDYSMVMRTVTLACKASGMKSPVFLSIATFYSWLAGEDPKTKRQADFQFDLELPCKDEIQEGNPVFVSIVDFGNKAASSAQKIYHQIWMEFISYCETVHTEQMEQQMKWGRVSNPALPLYQQVFFVSYGPGCAFPPGVKSHAYTISYPSLSEEDFGRLLLEYHGRNEERKREYREKNGLPPVEARRLRLEDMKDTLKWYANHMAGIKEQSVRRLLLDMRCEFQAGDVDYTKREKVEKVIAAYKRKVLRQHDRLEIITIHRAEEGAVRGLDHIERWIEEHREAMRLPQKAPGGVLLVGIPGTGKSAAAKMMAKNFNLPLVRLDMSRIFGGLVGDSEKGMREALEDLKFAAPCVLWIDEVEKAMSGADGKDGGNSTVQRLFGMLLTFMQENDRPVFTVTTSNDISKLPSEFFRNGRFDQAFCVMMPDYCNCCEIMLEKLRGFYKALGWGTEIRHEHAKQILNACVGAKAHPRFLTGADIEAHAKELFWHFVHKGKIATPTAEELAAVMKSVSATMRVQASPDSPSSMQGIAESYLDMMQRGMTMAGNQDTPFVKENLDLDAVRFYKFDEKNPDQGEPRCIKLPEQTAKEYGIRRQSEDPEKWYDVVFYDELVKAIGESVIFSGQTLPQAREEYWKLKQHQRMAASKV